MDKISGLPAHPLLVHIPVVLIPLAALGALVMLVWPPSRRHIKWITTGIACFGALGAILAASSGEGLEEMVERSGEIRDHAEAGDMARNLSILFAAVIVILVVGEWWMRRRAAAQNSGESSSGRLRTFVLVGTIVTVLAGGLATYAIVDAGHSGAEASWGDVVNENPNGQSGDGDSNDFDDDDD